MRIVAFCLRLKFKSQSKVLLPGELKRVEENVFQLLQREIFPEVHEQKQTFGNTSRVGGLAKFSSFFDDTGILRVGGRTKHADLSFEQRHPILLSTKHDFVNVLLLDLHLEHNHKGEEYAGSVIQQKL